MVGVSYHELTAGNPNPKNARHSAGQRKQFLLICVVGVAVCANAFINAGLLEPVMISDDGIYPGGDFIYKFLEDRDYATTGGLWRRISADLQEDSENINTLNLNGEDEEKKDENYDEVLYSIYIDKFNQGIGRFFTGILIDQSKVHLKEKLLNINKNIDKLKNSDDDYENKFKRLKYEVGDLPSVRSAYAVFPYTNGFVSALLHNYKVFPALEKYAQQNHGPNSKIIISTNCNNELKICHHYVPMIESEKFLLGQPDTEEYLNNKPKDNTFDIEKMLKGVKKLVGL